MTLLFGLSKRVGSSPRKKAFLTLRITSRIPGNLPKVTKKPATESRVVQGRTESSNPQEEASRPPQGKPPPFQSRRRGAKPPCFTGVSDSSGLKVIKSGTFLPPNIPPWNTTGLSKLSIPSICPKIVGYPSVFSPFCQKLGFP